MATTLIAGTGQPPIALNGGGGDGRPFRRSGPANHTLGVAFALAGIGMLFMALTSSYIVRQGLGGDWQGLPMPRILWASTIVLLMSSLTIESARLALRRGEDRLAGRWTFATLGLGLVFLTCQVMGFRTLAMRGYLLSTNPHSSFYYVLVGLHAFHLAGGLVALSFAAGRRRWIEGAAIYWHFMDGLWVYLLLLLFVWS